MASKSFINRADLEFMRETEAALRDAPPVRSTAFLCASATLVAALLTWAYLAVVEEVTRGEGQVVPSSKKQVIQSLEGGIVKNILVREGEHVKKGQVLLRIDDTGFASEYGELEAKADALRTQVARLTVEATSAGDGEIKFPEDVRKRAPFIIANEMQLYRARQSNLAAQISVLDERLQQRQHEVVELRETSKRLSQNLSIAKEELALKAPMARRRIVPKTEMLALKRTIADLKGELAVNSKAIPRVEAAIREAEGTINEARLKFREDAQREYNEKRAELSIVEQQITAAQDRVVRTDIRSPVNGVVNALFVNTVGGVVKNSEPIIEVTPMDDSLLVQARVRPQDIAFIRPGQKAVVKITAYDFSIYGGLDGAVDVISSDSTIDEQTRESYYTVTVRTQQTTLEKDGKKLPIIPGMVATVDILTGEKTVLAYLLKPITKARHEALRER